MADNFNDFNYENDKGINSRENEKPLIVLAGPTAVGKTETSIRLAETIGGEIISADSMQVYRHMDIGSAKISPGEMHGIRHHMIDVLEPWEEFSVAFFKRKCEEYIKEIYGRGHIPILTGGTGFYIQAILRDISFAEETDSGYRDELENIAAERGAHFLHAMLEKADPEAAEKIHENNIKRTIRALEFYRQTGEKISVHNERERQKESAYNSCYFVLNDKRELLYSRIDNRVDEMLDRGLVNEVKALREMGLNRSMVSMQGLGYKELLDYFEGKYTLDEAVALIKRDTRHFAKRQLTWFRRERDIIWVNKYEFEYDSNRILKFILDKIIEKGIMVNGQRQL
ncbi:MAG: tRNA (adenosine(37)-N6)-dimethylallyltransferase MiaA [Lachnospiraceae bacterium]|nr:tRNA (adenosine(37)-N6)-dimethylallyltransferase MiaA [Lachnospiraceae bacterium]